MKPIPYLIKQDPLSSQPIELTLFLSGRPRVITRDHLNFQDILYALSESDFHKIEQLVDIVQALLPPPTQSSNSGLQFSGVTGQMTYQGYPVASIFLTRALNLYKSGLTQPLQYFLKFLENLYQNPSSSVVNRLYQFLEHGNMPTTEDGCFLAYKKVTAGFKDIYTNTIDNSVGAVCTMPRSLINDDDNKTCEAGLHFCSYDYLSSYGIQSSHTVVILKINPRDVVAIPTDYNDTKGRCCEYTVVDHLVDYSKPTLSATATPVVFTPPIPASPAPAEQSTLQETELVDRLLKLTNSQLTKIYNNLLTQSPNPWPNAKVIDHVRSKFDGVRKIISKFSTSDVEVELLRFEDVEV
jgi:hypothetical protein